jgi:hypothetical protein
MTDEFPTLYQMSMRRGEKLILAHSMEHPIYERPADVIADILAYCEAHDVDFNEEVRMACKYIQDEKAEQVA